MQLLLNYLPPETQLWPQFLAEKRAAYRVFCKVIAGFPTCWQVMPSNTYKDNFMRMQELVVVPQDRGAKSHKDHPLSQHNDSRWAAFFKVSQGAVSPALNSQ